MAAAASCQPSATYIYNSLESPRTHYSQHGSTYCLVASPPHSVDDRQGGQEQEEDANLTLPVLSPAAAAAASPLSPDRAYFPHQPKSLAGIAVRSFCLGVALAIGVAGTVGLALFWPSPLWRLPFFLAALSLFHFLEFWTTAAYNTRAAEVSSFLLTANWPGYAIAHSFATLECLVTNLVWPDRAWTPGPAASGATLLCLLGLVLVIVGQIVRSVAMIQAGPSFNHLVQHQRTAGHVLVTTGIYARLRHPSYFGFFWWALGTQVVLGNPVSFILYAAVLWRFFSARIRIEEDFLVRFFGDEYLDYRKMVATRIPFVP
ncbi:Isoprenylcysteine carboxyl methyltransferase family-domain-containing protein [Lasiosphaeria miniovina]|uniref:Protein-S-isoprenylcysteine O-methyltransferase n=1 Tax=Lasiosphaeria miniovina TaxID=1954250 RepID=A0AA40A4G1_9PEZI|nr:Isoprenylcysteine carboxyl methyltransferase family-domain-containing protein [Lasiosphaeria miniovina]KAK0709118.1 Isoprenylcysteine carboxyl methyltransferase family-domain-containing protein [Lasiosphaeria miniovina]